MTRDDELQRLARAIDEDAGVDWDAMSSAASDESVRQTIRELAVIDAIAHADQIRSQPGSVDSWGAFRLLERVGQGAYGEVYRAWDTRLDREVALKLLPRAAEEHSHHETTIIEEGRLLARVRHPNIVTLFGAERIDGRVGLWMEFVQGRTLEQMLENGVFDETGAASVGIEVCSAVAAVHDAGLLHRDIKSQNVMRADDGRIALMDFGTGRIAGGEEAALDLAGTPLYLAPEVLLDGPATVRSDIYAVGVLLYHLLTGSFPVSGRTVGDLRRAHQAGERTSIDSARPGVSGELASIVERAMHPRPEARYSSASELAHHLRSFRMRHEGSELPVSDVSWRKRAVALALAGTIGGTAYTFYRSANEPRAPDISGEATAATLATRAFRLMDRRGLPNAQQATELFQEAIAKDPGFAPAHAGLASAYAFSAFPYRGLTYAEAYPIMKRAAERALALNPALAETHMALGWVFAFEHDWQKADAAFRQAMRLNPGLVQVYTTYSLSTLQPLRRYAEGLTLLETAAKHDPLSLDVERERGELEFYGGQYEDAVRTFQRIYKTEPDFPFVQTYVAKALTFAGRPAEALPLLEPGVPWLARVYVMTGRRPEAEKLASQWIPYPYRYAVISAALGDTDAAIDALERAAKEEPHRLGRLLNEPEVQIVHAHPRVAALRRAFGLP